MKTFMLVGLLVTALVIYLGLKWLWDNIELKDQENNKDVDQKKEDHDESN